MKPRRFKMLAVILLVIAAASALAWATSYFLTFAVGYDSGDSGDSSAMGLSTGSLFIVWDGGGDNDGFFYVLEKTSDDPSPPGFLGFTWAHDPGDDIVIGIPLWLLALAFGGGYWLLRKVREHPPGRCASCGYDLRATPDRCPECGTPATHAGSTEG